jgi:hypothetical protein
VISRAVTGVAHLIEPTLLWKGFRAVVVERRLSVRERVDKSRRTDVVS